MQIPTPQHQNASAPGGVGICGVGRTSAGRWAKPGVACPTRSVSCTPRGRRPTASATKTNCAPSHGTLPPQPRQPAPQPAPVADNLARTTQPGLLSLFQAFPSSTQQLFLHGRPKLSFLFQRRSKLFHDEDRCVSRAFAVRCYHRHSR